MADSARRSEQEGRNRRDLALLRNIMAAVNSSLELDQILDLVLRTIVETPGPGFAGMVLLTDHLHPGFAVATHAGFPAPDAPRRIFPDRCLCNEAMGSSMPIFAADCPGYGCHAAERDAGRHSHLVFPLKVQENVLGILCLFCPPDFEVEATELSLWEDIGTEIGWAIEYARLNNQIHQERELLHTLYEVSDHLAASLDLDWVLMKVLQLAISAAHAQDGSIFLLPAAGVSAPRILRRDLPPSEADQVIERVIEQGLAGWVMRHKTGTIVADTSQDPRWLAFSDEPSPPGSIIAVPLMADDKVLGILTLDHPEKNHFHNRQLLLMLAIAHQASTAIEKARLHKEVSQMAEVLAQRVEERTRELKETQVQLIQAEKLAALGELAAGIAHEINNPLHILQAYTEYLVSQAAPEDPILEFLEPMQDSLDSIARLSGQLRDFSRPGSGEWGSVEISDVLRGVLRLVNKELMRCQIQIETSIAPELPEVMGDARQLEQVFLNLILNARDAMPGGGRLTIESFVAENNVHIRFTDTGIGIDDDDLPKIFEPYFTTKEERGTGLGLAICQRIVAQHGGKITVSSQIGRGTAFTIQLAASRP